MNVVTRGDSITFPVHDVEPSREACPTMRLHENVREVLQTPIESCSDYHTPVCRGMGYQPVLAAVYEAYCRHLPLVLSPDAIWLTLAQGVAHHMALHGERLRERFVAHAGRLDLVFEFDDWIAGSPENLWGEAFESWADAIREHVGPDLHDAFVCDFSTTTAVERAAGRVVMMDVFEKYFRFVAVGICGIPEVTLRGTPADWDRLAEKVDALEPFDMPWWLEHVRPIVNQFARASRGDVDRDHWRNVCKLEDAYGGHVVNGWIGKLFPYLREFWNGPCSRRNPIFETGDGFQTFAAPSGLSCVPFRWIADDEDRAMEAIGGLVGVAQDETTLALEPLAGWAVRAASDMDVLIAAVKRDHEFTSPDPVARSVGDAERRPFGDGLAADMSRFYFEFETVRFFPDQESCTVRLRPRDTMQPLDWGEETEEIGTRGPEDRTWHRFADLPDGRYLAVNLDRCLNAVLHDDYEKVEDLIRDEAFHPICLSSESTRNVAGENPVIALTFYEFLRRLLRESTASGPYWEADGFAPYADADGFTRRKRP